VSISVNNFSEQNFKGEPGREIPLNLPLVFGKQEIKGGKVIPKRTGFTASQQVNSARGKGDGTSANAVYSYC